MKRIRYLPLSLQGDAYNEIISFSMLVVTD